MQFFSVFYDAVFLTLKGYSVISLVLVQSGIYIFKSAQYFCQLISLACHIPPGKFRCIRGGKFPPTSHPGNFWKFDILLKQGVLDIKKVINNKTFLILIKLLCGRIYQFNPYNNENRIKLYKWQNTDGVEIKKLASSQ